MTKIMAVPYVALLFHGLPNTVDLFKTSQAFILRPSEALQVQDVEVAM